MKYRDQERHFAWIGVRELYRENRRDAPSEDAKRVKYEYRVAKTKLYRKQFREDFPKYENQIDQDQDLANLANTDIKRIIAPFYPPIQNDDLLQKSRLRNPKKAMLDLTQSFFFLTTAFALGSYDIIKFTFCKTSPSLPLNLIGVLILIWIIKHPQPKDIEESNDIFPPVILSFTDLIKEIIDNPTKYPPRQYPNYKNFINNEQTNLDRSH